MTKPLHSLELKVKIQALLRECPEMNDDPVLRMDMLDGQLSFSEQLSTLVNAVRIIAGRIMGNELIMKDLKARHERYEHQETACRKMLKEIMDVANVRKLHLPQATLSIRAGQPSVQIIDSTVIPDAYWRVKREPNISLIKDLLKDGKDVPGAALNNAPDTLAILTK